MKYFLGGVFILGAILATTLWQDNAKKVLKEFWNLSLTGNLDKAKELTSDNCGGLRHTKEGGCGYLANADGTTPDPTEKEKILKEQIKIEKIVESASETARAGYRLETTDKNGRKANYFACLGKSSKDESWKVFLVTIASESEKISKSCFE